MKTALLATLLLTSLSCASAFALPQSQPQPILGEARSSLGLPVDHTQQNTAQQPRLELTDSGYFKTPQGRASDLVPKAQRNDVADSGYFKTPQGRSSELQSKTPRHELADSGYFKTPQGKASGLLPARKQTLVA
ncbi:hypothetical protein [Pseudomonas sp. Marseille-Q8238]